MIRRLPVYILIDTSGSMQGEPIESVKVGLETMVSSLRQDPYALETVYLSIITYDREVKQILPLTALDELQLPEIHVPESGPTNTGAALQMLKESINREVTLSTPQAKGDWMPILFIMTDGKPSDILLYNQMVPEIKRMHFTNIVGCAAGMRAKVEPLQLLTNHVYSLDTMDTNSFKAFFQWVSGVIVEGGKSVGTVDPTSLPPAPEDLNFVY